MSNSNSNGVMTRPRKSFLKRVFESPRDEAHQRQTVDVNAEDIDLVIVNASAGVDAALASTPEEDVIGHFVETASSQSSGSNQDDEDEEEGTETHDDEDEMSSGDALQEDLEEGEEVDDLTALNDSVAVGPDDPPSTSGPSSPAKAERGKSILRLLPSMGGTDDKEKEGKKMKGKDSKPKGVKKVGGILAKAVLGGKSSKQKANFGEISPSRKAEMQALAAEKMQELQKQQEAEQSAFDKKISSSFRDRDDDDASASERAETNFDYSETDESEENYNEEEDIQSSDDDRDRSIDLETDGERASRVGAANDADMQDSVNLGSIVLQGVAKRRHSGKGSHNNHNNDEFHHPQRRMSKDDLHLDSSSSGRRTGVRRSLSNSEHDQSISLASSTYMDCRTSSLRSMVSGGDDYMMANHMSRLHYDPLDITNAVMAAGGCAGAAAGATGDKRSMISRSLSTRFFSRTNSKNTEEDEPDVPQFKTQVKQVSGGEHGEAFAQLTLEPIVPTAASTTVTSHTTTTTAAMTDDATNDCSFHEEESGSGNVDGDEDMSESHADQQQQATSLPESPSKAKLRALGSMIRVPSFRNKGLSVSPKRSNSPHRKTNNSLSESKHDKLKLSPLASGSSLSPRNSDHGRMPQPLPVLDDADEEDEEEEGGGNAEKEAEGSGEQPSTPSRIRERSSSAADKYGAESSPKDRSSSSRSNNSNSLRAMSEHNSSSSRKLGSRKNSDKSRKSYSRSTAFEDETSHSFANKTKSPRPSHGRRGLTSSRPREEDGSHRDEEEHSHSNSCREENGIVETTLLAADRRGGGGNSKNMRSTTRSLDDEGGSSNSRKSLNSSYHVSPHREAKKHEMLRLKLHSSRSDRSLGASKSNLDVDFAPPPQQIVRASTTPIGSMETLTVEQVDAADPTMQRSSSQPSIPLAQDLAAHSVPHDETRPVKLLDGDNNTNSQGSLMGRSKKHSKESRSAKSSRQSRRKSSKPKLGSPKRSNESDQAVAAKTAEEGDTRSSGQCRSPASSQQSLPTIVDDVVLSPPERGSERNGSSAGDPRRQKGLERQDPHQSSTMPENLSPSKPSRQKVKGVNGISAPSPAGSATSKSSRRLSRMSKQPEQPPLSSSERRRRRESARSEASVISWKRNPNNKPAADSGVGRRRASMTVVTNHRGTSHAGASAGRAYRRRRSLTPASQPADVLNNARLTMVLAAKEVEKDAEKEQAEELIAAGRTHADENVDASSATPTNNDQESDHAVHRRTVAVADDPVGPESGTATAEGPRVDQGIKLVEQHLATLDNDQGDVDQALNAKSLPFHSMTGTGTGGDEQPNAAESDVLGKTTASTTESEFARFTREYVSSQQRCEETRHEVEQLETEIEMLRVRLALIKERTAGMSRSS